MHPHSSESTQSWRRVLSAPALGCLQTLLLQVLDKAQTQTNNVFATKAVCILGDVMKCLTAPVKKTDASQNKANIFKVVLVSKSILGQLNYSITDLIKDINSWEISVILRGKSSHFVAWTQCRTKLFLRTQELIQKGQLQTCLTVQLCGNTTWAPIPYWQPVSCS